MPLLNFPAIFVKGVFLGGFDALQDSVANNHFSELVAAERQSGVRRQIADPKVLFSGPRGQPWYCFQLHVYANYIRALSLVHVVLFGLCFAASWKTPIVSNVVLWVMTVDLLVFFITGPTPLAPISTVVTLIVWRFRGNAVTSFPYKFIFFVYLYEFLEMLYCGEISPFSSCVGSDGGRGRLAGLALNSSLLAFFRF